MGRLTQRLYRAWIAQNGGQSPAKPPAGGMGGVPPMKAQHSPAKPSSRVTPCPPAREAAARPAKRYSYISE